MPTPESAFERTCVRASSGPDAGPTRNGIVLSANRRRRRQIARVLRAVGVDVSGTDGDHRPDQAGDASGLLVYDLVDEVLAPDERERILSSHTEPILLTRTDDFDRLAELFDRPYCRHVVGVSPDGVVSSRRLAVIVRKMIDRDIMGIEKYLRWGSLVESCPLRHTSEKPLITTRLDLFLSDLSCRPRVANVMVTAAEEFILNALYDAPFDRDAGVHRYASLPRTEPVQLLPEQEARFCFGSDGQVAAIGCRDPFGSLSPDVLRTSLARGFRRDENQIHRGEGGAGIGLYMSFNLLDQLVVNIDPGRTTEFIGLIDIATEAPQNQLRPRSFDIFVS